MHTVARAALGLQQPSRAPRRRGGGTALVEHAATLSLCAIKVLFSCGTPSTLTHSLNRYHL